MKSHAPETEAGDRNRSALVAALASRAWQVVKPQAARFPAAAIERVLEGLVSPAAVAYFLARVPSEVTRDEFRSPEDALDALVSPDVRRKRGVYFTPPWLAEHMARRLEIERGRVLDLAAGAGALLTAVARTSPSIELYGVERDPLLAVGCGLAIFAARQGRPRPGDYVSWGDGLAAHGIPEADAVVGNPPYVGEKGNRELFAGLRRDHPHLAPYFAGKMDLHYLFVHRGLDLLRPGGRLIYLTSEYWLTADSARALRADLLERGVLEDFLRFETRPFADAPGHHSLVFSLRRRTEDAPQQTPSPRVRVARVRDGRVEVLERVEPAPSAFTPARFTPFVPAETAEAFRSPRVFANVVFADVARDRQGIVSGADRTTRRHQKWLPEVTPDQPVFVFHHDELPEDPRLPLFPLVRRSDCQPNQVLTCAPAQADHILYVDGELRDELRDAVEALLQPFRPLLERRREAQTGAMPWYRLHWPRRREDFLRPKLVVPRRAKKPRFLLDLSGSCVSSDCTYVLAPGEATDELAHLVNLMCLLNSDRTARYLRHFGKSKGEIIEFYSTPLASIPLDARWCDGVLTPCDPQVAAQANEVLARLR